MNDSNQPEEPSLEGFAKDLGKSLVEEGKTWLRWAGVGALIGGIGLGGAGGYLFGLSAVLYGAVAGAAIGAVLGWLLYLALSSGGL